MHTRKRNRTKQQLLDSLWQRIDVRGANDCWHWTGALSKRGYGSAFGMGRTWPAHRLLYVLTRGATELEVCHSCDNKRCCNPAHLSAGTHTQNMREARERNLLKPARGEDNPFSKLTPESVNAIRTGYLNGVRQIDLAARFGVTQSCISGVVLGKTWSHLKSPNWAFQPDELLEME